LKAAPFSPFPPKTSNMLFFPLPIKGASIFLHQAARTSQEGRIMGVPRGRRIVGFYCGPRARVHIEAIKIVVDARYIIIPSKNVHQVCFHVHNGAGKISCLNSEAGNS
jgi:hypothetical protein